MEEKLDENPNPTPSSIDDSFENVERPSPYSNTSGAENFSPPPRRRSPKKLLYILGLVVVALVLLNAVRLLGSKGKSASPTPTPAISIKESPTPAETSTPEPTKKPVSSIDATTGLDRAKLSVSVQNGSGVTGAAAKASDLLKSLGYNVTSTGNADNSNFTSTTIKVKPASKDYLPVLNKDLSSNGYSIGATSSDLVATASADALVIVGK